MAKDKKRRIPKKIGGVKVPKKLRRTAEQALEMAENPAARHLAAAALGAAATAFVNSAAAGKLRRDAEDAAGRARDRADEIGRRAGEIGEAVRAAAADALRRVLDAIEAETERVDADASPPAKPKRPRRKG